MCTSSHSSQSPGFTVKGENIQGRSTGAEGPSLRRVRHPTATVRNRQQPTVLCGSREGSLSANMILLASQNFLNHQSLKDNKSAGNWPDGNWEELPIEFCEDGVDGVQKMTSDSEVSCAKELREVEI
ncbi:hypothetical protein Tco_0009488 [Tanacetum coccineum]